MEKRMTSLFLALALCLSLLPAAALAAGTTVYGTIEVGGIALTNSESTPTVYATTDAATGAVTAQPTFTETDGWNIKWDGSTLTLRNATIQQAEEYSEKNNEKIAIYLASGNMNLVLVGENTVDALGEGSAASCGINLGNGGLTIRGEEGASLSVFGGDTTNTTNSNSCGIYATGAITIDSGTVTVTGESASAASYGICARGAVTIEDGTVTATGGNAVRDSYGIDASSFTINGGTVVATGGEAAVRYSMGVRADGGITINDGVVTATGDTAPDFSYGMCTSGNFTMNGGIVTATSGEAQLTYGIRGGSLTIKSGTLDATSGKTVGDSVGIFAAYDIKIDGGTVTAKGGETIGDGWYNFGIRSHSGSVIITDGTVTATGGKANGTGGENHSAGIFVRTGSITVSGGTVTATGGESTGSGINYSAGLYAGVSVTVSGGTATATGGLASTGSTADAGGSYGIFVESEDTSTVTINGNSVVRADMTGTEGDDGKPISGDAINRNSGVIFENGEGTVHGNVTLQEDLTIEADESLTIPQGATLTIPEDTTLTNEGALTNNGTITNSGTLTNNGTLTIGQGGSLTGNVSGNVLYAVTVVTSGSGSASASPTAAEEGEIITLTASHSSGYHFERWEVVSGGVTLTGNQFTMPASPVTVKAVFEKNPYIPPTYAVTVPETTGGTVEVSPSRASSGRRVTITTQPAPGYELESLTVLDSRGSEIALTDQGDGKYTFTMPSRKVTVQASFAPVPLPFTDVAEDVWYEEAVRYAYFHNIMEGTSATTFVPSKSLTRAEAVQVLYNLEGQPTVSGNVSFPDLVYEWYKPAIAWAEQTSVVDGYEDGTFRPDEPVTRQEFAQMLYNYAAYKGYDLTAQGDLSSFPDGNEVQEWAVPAMAWANGNELINGHDEGTLEPTGTTTRAQAASILMRFDQKLVEN